MYSRIYLSLISGIRFQQILGAASFNEGRMCIRFLWKKGILMGFRRKIVQSNAEGVELSPGLSAVGIPPRNYWSSSSPFSYSRSSYCNRDRSYVDGDAARDPELATWIMYKFTFRICSSPISCIIDRCSYPEWRIVHENPLTPLFRIKRKQSRSMICHTICFPCMNIAQ